MGRTIQGSFSGHAKFIKEQLAAVKTATLAASVNAAELGTALAIAETDKKGSVDRGQLKNAWESKPMVFGAQIRNGAPYAGYVEQGTRPHFPPLKPILAWVMRQFQKDEQDAMPIARAIQWKIFHHGTKPKFIMKDILPKISKVWQAEIESAIEKIS